MLRRAFVKRRLKGVGEIWPIDPRAAKKPDGWPGWPDDKRFALVLTHDVDTLRGYKRCRDLVNLEVGLGFRSSFNYVAEKYGVSKAERDYLISNDFEVGVHGLLHDGHYFDSREQFNERAHRINKYLKDWGAVGYRSPSMISNLKWFHDLDIQYDASTFDTDPFEPTPQGVRTIFPFLVPGGKEGKAYVELPYTLPQDFTLFTLMKNSGIDIWKRKLGWIAQVGGMALLNTHPDYMGFPGKPVMLEDYPASLYSDFLRYVKTTYEGQYWHVLPRELASWFLKNGADCKPCQARKL